MDLEVTRYLHPKLYGIDQQPRSHPAHRHPKSSRSTGEQRPLTVTMEASGI